MRHTYPKTERKRVTPVYKEGNVPQTRSFDTSSAKLSKSYLNFQLSQHTYPIQPHPLSRPSNPTSPNKPPCPNPSLPAKNPSRRKNLHFPPHKHQPRPPSRSRNDPITKAQPTPSLKAKAQYTNLPRPNTTLLSPRPVRLPRAAISRTNAYKHIHPAAPLRGRNTRLQ